MTQFGGGLTICRIEGVAAAQSKGQLRIWGGKNEKPNKLTLATTQEKCQWHTKSKTRAGEDCNWWFLISFLDHNNVTEALHRWLEAKLSKEKLIGNAIPLPMLCCYLN